MIYLITGTPGAGKTSNTLWHFLFDPDFKSREKYATPIKGFDYERHGVTPLDSLESWQDLPDGALILCDEADQYLPVSKPQAVPEYIRELARHRHRGFDFLIITQQASMINHFVRGLVERHIHYHRAMGLEKTSRYQWETLQKQPDSPTAKSMGLMERVKPNPKVYELYQSATVNTRQVQLPWHAIARMAGIIALMVAAGVFVWWYMYGRHQPVEAVAVAQAVPVLPVAGAIPAPGARPADVEPSKPANSAADFIPRSPGMPWTAPAYDHLTQPTDFPRIAGCMVGAAQSCRCYTQQATPVHIDKEVCLAMVKQGWFDPWRTQRAQSDAVLSGKPEEASARQGQRLAQASQDEPVMYSFTPGPHYTTDRLKGAGVQIP